MVLYSSDIDVVPNVGPTHINEVATKNGSIPISIKRVNAVGASFVNCRNTKCPVRDAWIAFSAVSLSRVSPIRMMSES